MEQKTFTKRNLLNFWAELEDGPGDYLTVYVRPSSFPQYAREAAEQASFNEGVKEAICAEVVLREAARYGTGAVLFCSRGGRGYIILPPFPVTKDKALYGRPQTSELQELLEKERTLGVVLVNWGSYALGVLRGVKLVEYRTGTGYIHKRHRKGGRSEKRFARRTEEQKKDFLRRVANRIEQSFRGYHLEQVFFGGNRLMVGPLLEECTYLKGKVQQISKRFFSVRYADRETLLKSVENVGKSLFFSY